MKGKVHAVQKIREGSSSISDIWMHVWEVVQEFCPGPFHRGGKKYKNLHYFLLSPYLKSTESESSDSFYCSASRSWPKPWPPSHWAASSRVSRAQDLSQSFWKLDRVGYCPVPGLTQYSWSSVPHLAALSHSSPTGLGRDLRGETRGVAMLLSQTWWARAAGRGERLSACTRSAHVWQTVLEIVWVREDVCLRRNCHPSRVCERSLPDLGGQGVASRSDAGAHFI